MTKTPATNVTANLRIGSAVAADLPNRKQVAKLDPFKRYPVTGGVEPVTLDEATAVAEFCDWFTTAEGPTAGDRTFRSLRQGYQRAAAAAHAAIERIAAGGDLVVDKDETKPKGKTSSKAKAKDGTPKGDEIKLPVDGKVVAAGVDLEGKLRSDSDERPTLEAFAADEATKAKNAKNFRDARHVDSCVLCSKPLTEAAAAKSTTIHVVAKDQTLAGAAFRGKVDVGSVCSTCSPAVPAERKFPRSAA